MGGTEGRGRCVAVMAGGRGLRLWPRSTACTPKQFRRFFGMPTLLEQSLARASLLAPPDCVYVVTAEELLPAAEPLLPPGVRVLAEPFGRDTAACIGLAALRAEQEHPGAVLIVLPADHWVGDDGAFARTLVEAASLAEADGGLVTVGIRPTRPETGYGYLLAEPSSAGVYRGRRFREKPSAAEAEQLIAAETTFWNAGIFVARASTFLELIRRHLPGLAAGLDCIRAGAGDPDEARLVREVYEGIRPVSFDHAVAEHLTAFWVLPAGFEWDDLGSWTAFRRHLPRDGAGNLTAGAVHLVDALDCLVDTPGLRTLLLGVQGLIVIREGDALLIADASRTQELKGVVARLGLDEG